MFRFDFKHFSIERILRVSAFFFEEKNSVQYSFFFSEIYTFIGQVSATGLETLVSRSEVVGVAAAAAVTEGFAPIFLLRPFAKHSF